jgi:hypothetical protein
MDQKASSLVQSSINPSFKFENIKNITDAVFFLIGVLDCSQWNLLQLQAERPVSTLAEKSAPNLPDMIYAARTLEFQSRALKDIADQLGEVKTEAEAERVMQ